MTLEEFNAKWIVEPRSAQMYTHNKWMILINRETGKAVCYDNSHMHVRFNNFEEIINYVTNLEG